MKELILSWDEVDTGCRALSKLISDESIGGIVAIARGGLCPAGLLSQYLSVHLIQTLCMHSYDGRVLKELKVLSVPELPTDNANWVVIDDIADSGDTMRYVKRAFPGALRMALVAKPAGKDTVDYFVKEVPQDTWVIFPWEGKVL